MVVWRGSGSWLNDGFLRMRSWYQYWELGWRKDDKINQYLLGHTMVERHHREQRALTVDDVLR